MRPLSRHLASFTTAALLALAAPAAAHIGEPTASRVFVVDDEAGEQAWVLHTNFGVIDSGAPTRFACEEAFLGGDVFHVAPLSTSSWVTFGNTSIQRTTDGCDFEEVMALSRPVTDVDVSPASAEVAFVTNGPEEGGIWYSADAGASFEAIPFDTATYQLTALRFLGEGRLLVSAYDRTQGGAAYLAVVDTATDAVTALSLPDGVSYPYVLAATGETVLWLGRRTGQVVFWGSLDEPTARARPAAAWPSGAALSDDGATAWIGGLEEGSGLTVGTIDPTADPAGPDAAATWETLHAETPIGCVGQREGRVYVCSKWRLTGFDLFELTADGALDGVVAFDALEGPRQCPATSDVADVCPLVWTEIAPQFGPVAPGADAGGAGADAGADAGPGAGPDAGPEGGGPADPDAGRPGADPATGCATTPGRAGEGGAALLLGLLGLLVSRRREERP